MHLLSFMLDTRKLSKTLVFGFGDARVGFLPCGRHYRVSCNVQPPIKLRSPITISHLLNSKTRLMTPMLKHALRDGKWCHLGLPTPYLFKSNWTFGAPTHSISQKYHQKMLSRLDIYKDEWSPNKGALRWHGADQLGSLGGVLSKCACQRNDDIT